MHDVLKAPIEWSNVTAGCADHVAALQHGEWVVRAYGPTLAAGSLVATLTKGAQVNAILDGASAAKGASYCGVPMNEPIAIVGMAGRFPEAASHDELWNVLEKGMDCAKVVSLHEVYSFYCEGTAKMDRSLPIASIKTCMSRMTVQLEIQLEHCTAASSKSQDCSMPAFSTCRHARLSRPTHSNA